MKLRQSSVHCLILVLAAMNSFADGYTITVPNGWSLIANHLDNPPNDLNTVLGASLPNKSQLQKWNCTGPMPSFRSVGSWSPNQTLAPGEGAIVNNPGPAVQVTFTGTLHVPVLPVTLCRA